MLYYVTPTVPALTQPRTIHKIKCRDSRITEPFCVQWIIYNPSEQTDTTRESAFDSCFRKPKLFTGKTTLFLENPQLKGHKALQRGERFSKNRTVVWAEHVLYICVLCMIIWRGKPRQSPSVCIRFIYIGCQHEFVYARAGLHLWATNLLRKYVFGLNGFCLLRLWTLNARVSTCRSACTSTSVKSWSLNVLKSV